MGAPQPQLRRPNFLEGIVTKDTSLADFGRVMPGARAAALHPPPAPSASTVDAQPEPMPSPPPPSAYAVGLAELSPPPTPPRLAFGPDAHFERLAHAIESLKQQNERLAEQARSDALEIGLMVAERILEQEIATNPRALISLVRTAMRKLAESKNITVYLCAADVERLNERVKAAAPEASALASVKLVVDAALLSGDCRVESELGSVDGKVSSRIAEMRRSLEVP